MSKLSQRTPVVDRALGLHKMIRLIVHALGGEGYLNFIGNEFGHPEWLDFPRKGNLESYKHARRQFNLVDDDLLRYGFLNNWDGEMNSQESKIGWLSAQNAFVTKKDQGDKVIIFDRANAIFVFNFHHTKSFTDYLIGVRQAGKYRLVLDSDRAEFDGHSRLEPNQEYFSQEQSQDQCDHSISFYLPSRTCFILQKFD
jgi:1,4-alpha-glucan branching enzyme